MSYICARYRLMLPEPQTTKGNKNQKSLNAPLKPAFTEGGMININTRKHEHSPAVLWGIQRQEVHAGKHSGQGVEMRCQAGWELAPGGEEQHHRALCAVSIQELHQVLREMKNEDTDWRMDSPPLEFYWGIKTVWLCFIGIISKVRSCLLQTRWLDWT